MKNHRKFPLTNEVAKIRDIQTSEQMIKYIRSCNW